MEIFLSSIGCLRDSRIERGNSGISSKKRMPWFAIDISPGDAFGPPPMIEIVDEV